MRGMLLALFVLLSFSASVFAEGDLNAPATVDAPSAEAARAAPPTKKWYAGAAYSDGMLSPALDQMPTDSYYSTLGYLKTGGSGWGVMNGVKLYAGYRIRDFLDVEMGLSGGSMNLSSTYKNFSGNTVWSRRQVGTGALYAAALLRPADGFGHFMFLKLGAHSSSLYVTKSVTGNAANLSVIAAGDHLPVDGTSNGYGPLLGVGFDIGTGRVGAVRLDLDYYYKIGGTTYSAAFLNIGYHGNF